jgi:hypothetical protein
MRTIARVVGIFAASVLLAQSAEQTPTSMDALRFLQGTWEAKTAGGPEVSGSYSFKTELEGHVLARHSSSDKCKGPAGFDCDHHDLLYIYQDAPGQPLKAIYFDNEGHVIHYDIFTSGAAKVTFVSSGSAPGPRFRLVYELRESVLSGKFQGQMPGQADWKSYLEWSGPRK